MTAEILGTAFSLAVAIACLFLAMELWHRAWIIRSRDRAFALRADLFDAALHASCFDDVAYGAMRMRLNGFLRYADQFSGTRLLALFIAVFFLSRRKRQDLLDPRIPGLSQSPIRDTIEHTNAGLTRLIGSRAAIGTPSGLAIVIALYAAGQVRRALKATTKYLSQIGSDDDYARQERDSDWWSSRFTPQLP